MTNERLPIVVGIDGSPESRAALDWAIAQARHPTVPLRLIYALDPYRTYLAMQRYGTVLVPEQERARGIATKLLATSAEHVAEVAPDIVVTTHFYDDDDAIEILLDESARASTIVLGSRRMGAFGSVLMGSVGAGVAARASCPIVVLRGPSGMVEERAGVIVGVDAREPSESALAYAFDFASWRSLPLHAVLCWHLDPLAEMLWRPPLPVPNHVEAWLSEAMAGWREKYPDVSVQQTVVRDHPVAGLVAAAAAQYLLVVGTRGHHALSGTLLGSVSQGVLHHATCPVAVVPLSVL